VVIGRVVNDTWGRTLDGLQDLGERRAAKSDG
jgi:hypothetical protein